MFALPVHQLHNMYSLSRDVCSLNHLQSSYNWIWWDYKCTLSHSQKEIMQNKLELTSSWLRNDLGFPSQWLFFFKLLTSYFFKKKKFPHELFNSAFCFVPIKFEILESRPPRKPHIPLPKIKKSHEKNMDIDV